MAAIRVVNEPVAIDFGFIEAEAGFDPVPRTGPGIVVVLD
jgi:hypothetical protein